MSFQAKHRVILTAVALASGCAIAACAGTPNAIASRPAHVAGRLAAPPAPASTEFFNGITSNSNPRGITKGPNGMWFTENNVDKIARITSTGVVTEFGGLTPGSHPNNIVKGSDNNLWFTESNADAIGRMTGTGRVRVFSTGNEAYGPFDITAGSDGNLWFTFRSPSLNAIGRMTTAGIPTLFTAGLSPGDVAVHDITTGPDGNMWFTEEFGNRIGRITPGGSITEFSNGITANAGLSDITAGPDGNLWFAETGLGQIGRITTSGVVTEFASGITPGAQPGSLVAAKGFIWFNEINMSKLGRASLTGHITEYAIPAAVPSDIAVGAPNNALWITDLTGNGIVRVLE